ncbi:hypothetical protein [Schlesneria sp.]|uniref:hypothetical protein n=1 Tax=Schlesneria sp. TaxID=2762018 RepID=UPI002EDF49BB
MRILKVGAKIFSIAFACSFVLYMARIYYLAEVYGEDDFYAQWGATEMVTSYMNEHDGAWPRSWDDLRELYDAGGGRVGGWTFEQYQDRVFIDFAANVKDLQELSLRPGPVKFNVIYARVTGTGRENFPNENIRKYFQRKYARAEQPSVEVTD